MNEISLTGRKNGMGILVLTILLYLAAFAGILFLAGSRISPLQIAGIAVCVLWICLGWILLLGLKVLGPQEALVLTLFGKYTGTLKGPGFFFVHPFSVAVNPAAKTKLSQSGDVDGGKSGKLSALLTGSAAGTAAAKEGGGKKLSLKLMTLNNNRQKINDCLGNPVEIGIAVTWRVTDTAKAVFEVDNYKEFLSLQCDSALRNIVRLYPYDMAPGVDTTGDGVADVAACGAPAT